MTFGQLFEIQLWTEEKQRGTGTQNASPQVKVKQEIVFSEKIKWVFSNSLFEDIRKQSKGKFI